MATLDRLASDLVGTRLRVNTRFIVRGLVALAVAAGVLAGLYRWQSQKLVAAYRAQADKAKADDQPAKEVDYLRRYLLLNPGDAPARARLGLGLARVARRPVDRQNAYFTLQEAIRLDPAAPADTRLQAVRMAMQLGLAEEAKRGLDGLMALKPDDPEYETLYADCLIGLREYPPADQILTAAVKHDRTRVEAYSRQAFVRLLKLNRKAQAIETIEAMLAANPESADAQVAAADFFKAAGDPDRYAQAVRRARALAPANPDVVFAVADLLVEDADKARRQNKPAERKALFGEATKLVTQLLADLTPKLPPKDVPPAPGGPAEKAVGGVARGYHLLVDLSLRTGDTAGAEEWAKKQIAALPNSPVAKLDLADTLIGNNHLDEADPLLADLIKAAFAPDLVDFLRGRVYAKRKQWTAACRALEAAVGRMGATNPPAARKANLLLALCYRETGEIDLRADAFRLAVPATRDDPDWVPAVAGLAEALVQLGRPADAVPEYRKLATVVPAYRAEVARLALAAVRAKPADKRGPADWDAVEAEIKQVPAGPDADALAADLASARGDLAGARSLLAEAAAAAPKSGRGWADRLAVELADPKAGKPAVVVAQAVAELGDTAETRLLRLRVAAAGPPTADGLTALAAGADKLTPADRRALFLPLASVAVAWNQRDAARTWLAAVAADFPDDLKVHFARFDIALLDKDRPAVGAVLADIARTSGGPDTVPSRVCRAFALLDEYKPGDPPEKLAEAAALLTGLEKQRAGWSRLYLAQARVADFQGDAAGAAKKYRTAVELGERAPAVVGRLLELYYRGKMYADAATLIQLVPPPPSGAGVASQVVAELALGAKNFTLAAQKADDAVPVDTADADKLIWLANIKVAAGKVAEAEAPLRRATALAPKRPVPWLNLVQVLHNLNKPAAEIEAVMKAMDQAVPPADAPLVTAQAYETVGRLDDARRVLDKATAGPAAPPAALKAAAGFYVRRDDPVRALPLAERLLAADAAGVEDKAFARRTIALILSSGRKPDQVAKALAVLNLAGIDDAAAVTDATPTEELRTRAMVLARIRGRRSRAVAAGLLDTVAKRGAVTADDHFLLGSLHESLGNWPAARPHLAAAAEAPDAARPVVVAWAFALMRNNEPGLARSVVEQVVKAVPADPTGVELRVRLAVGEGPAGRGRRGRQGVRRGGQEARTGRRPAGTGRVAASGRAVLPAGRRHPGRPAPAGRVLGAGRPAGRGVAGVRGRLGRPAAGRRRPGRRRGRPPGRRPVQGAARQGPGPGPPRRPGRIRNWRSTWPPCRA